MNTWKRETLCGAHPHYLGKIHEIFYTQLKIFIKFRLLVFEGITLYIIKTVCVKKKQQTEYSSLNYCDFKT